MKKPLPVLSLVACAVALISMGLSMAGLDYNHWCTYSMTHNTTIAMLLGALNRYQESGEKKWLCAAAFLGAFLLLWPLLAWVVQRFRA